MVFTLIKQFLRSTVGALHTKGHRLGRDATLLVFSNLIGVQAVLASVVLPDKFRTILVGEHLPHLAPYKSCIKATSEKTNIPEILLLSILLQENGRVGKSSINNNRTKDHGPGQINDVRSSEIARIGLSIDDVRDDACKNVIGVGYLLSNELKKANGELWTAVGNYHYSKYGPHPQHHYRYIKRVHAKWSKLYATLKSHSVTASPDIGNSETTP